MEKLVPVIFTVAAAFVAGAFSDEFSILKSPQTVSFQNGDWPLPGERISDLVSLTMGFSIEEDLSWPGLIGCNLFQRPLATVLITVKGMDKLALSKDGKVYPVENLLDKDIMVDGVKGSGQAKKN